MNQAKNKYENLLILHYKLCSASASEMKDITEQISEALKFIKKYNLFPLDLPNDFDEQLDQLCNAYSNELRLEIAKELYVFLSRLILSFQRSNNDETMSFYSRILELSRTEFSYEQANEWVKEIYNNDEFRALLSFLNKNKFFKSSEELFLAKRDKLREIPIDLNSFFKEERALPSDLRSIIEKTLQEKYRIYNEYIENNYSSIKRAFSSYHKEIHVYIQSRSEDSFLLMTNIYEGTESKVVVYPNYVDIMYSFNNVEAIDNKMSGSSLTHFMRDEYSCLGHGLDIYSIHYQLNRIFVRYASDSDLLDYFVYILRGQLKKVSIINRAEIEVNNDKCVLFFTKIPPIKDLLISLTKRGKKPRYVAFRSNPGDDVIESLEKLDISVIDVRHQGRLLIMNQNGDMIHWFIKSRLENLQVDDSYKDIPKGDRLIEQLKCCPKGKEGWKQYEDIGSEIFHFLFSDNFRNYHYKYQLSTSDSIHRRDLLINNTYKDNSCFWQTARTNFKCNVIIIDFKNYQKELNQDEFYKPTKYFNSSVGSFAILFSRYGLDESAKKEQLKLLSKDQLVLCLTDEDLINMINQKMNGQEPLYSLENMYYSLCMRQ